MRPTADEPPSAAIRRQFGDIDIYLFDQFARGRFDQRRRVLDVGCGGGRNLRYALGQGYHCAAIDPDPAAIARVRREAAALGRHDVIPRLVIARAEAIPWPTAAFDVVVCSAVLHFAADAEEFGRMVTEMWRLLAPGGLFFARLASTIGLDGFAGAAGRRVRLPDGSDRFVVDETMLLEWTARLGGTLADPLKTTNVQQMRCMTTWCVVR